MLTMAANLPLLRIEPVGQPPGAVLRCAGEIDLSNVECLRHALDTSIHLGVPEVELDMRQVSFLDSSAIEALMVAYRQLASEGRALRVRATAWIARLLHMVELDHLLADRAD
jgi:anti-anti-sigma factor